MNVRAGERCACGKACQRDAEARGGGVTHHPGAPRPIGSFQAIKHRLADCLVMVEAGRSASWAAMAAAADFVASPSTAARERLVALARVASSYCNEGVAHIASETVQLHGGIAITWEHDAHLIFKTAHTLGVLAGAPHTVRNEMDR